MSNNLIYKFNTQGKIISVSIENDDSYKIDFNYKNNSFYSIEYLNGDVSTSVTINENNGVINIRISSTNMITLESTYYDFVKIENRTEDGDVSSKVTFKDGKFVVYEINHLKQLVKITDETKS